MKRILIVGPAWVGDMMMAQTLFSLIKQREPDAQIDVLAPDWTRPLLLRMPEVHTSIDSNLMHGEFGFKKRLKLAKTLRKEKYDQAIVLRNSFKSALIPFFAGIKKRTGWRGEYRYGLLNDMRVLDTAKYPLMIERFMALGLPSCDSLPENYSLPKLSILEENIKTALATYQLNPEKKIVALCPGAEFGVSKRWLPAYFAEVANQKIKEGFQIWLFGSKNDKPIAEEIQALTNSACVNLIAKTKLNEAIDLLSLSDVVVTNDSGLMHIAAALQKPMVAIYGSTSTQFTPPLSDKVKVLQLDLDCQPCFKRECPLKHFNCMKNLKSQKVLAAINEVAHQAKAELNLV